MSFPPVLNNLMVARLREGAPEAVGHLVTFGVRPEWELDEVVEGETHRRTVWGWAHEAEKPEAVVAWWGWVGRYLNSTTPEKASQEMKRLFVEALQVTLPLGRASVLVETWRRTVEWLPRLPGWSRTVMVRHAIPVLSSAGDAAVPCLELLESAGLWSRSDWSRSARATYPVDPVQEAVKTSQPRLLDHIVRRGGPELAGTESALSLAWEVSREGAGTDESIDALMVLLRHGASGTVTYPGGGIKPLRECLVEADGLSPLLAAAIHDWGLRGQLPGAAPPRRRTRI